jgi:hypothetical protein
MFTDRDQTSVALIAASKRRMRKLAKHNVKLVSITQESA